MEGSHRSGEGTVRSAAILSMLSSTSLLLIATAIILIGAMSTSASVSALLIGCALVLVGLGFSGRFQLVTGSEGVVGASVAMIATLGLLGPTVATYPSSIASMRPVLLALGSAACVVAITGSGTRGGRRVAAILAVLAALITVAAMVSREWGSDIGSDVYRAHLLAGRALANFENPYTDAVQFADGNPFAPDRVVSGYPYPPVVLLLYGVTAMFTDPRLVSAIGWLVVLAWLGWRADSNDEQSARTSLGLLLIMALAPLGGFVWFMAWTEPVTLALFLATALVWRRSTTGSGILLGVALASKQYMVLLAPFLLFHRENGSRRRALAAVFTAGLTTAVGLIPGPRAFLQATIGNLSQIGFRPDTQSLSGLLADMGVELLLPNAIWIGISLVLTSLLARSSHSRSGFLVRAGLGLGIAFMLGMAFPNYWFLVGGLIGLGAVLAVEDERPVALLA